MALLIIDRALKIGKSTVDGGKREMTKFWEKPLLHKSFKRISLGTERIVKTKEKEEFHIEQKADSRV